MAVDTPVLERPTTTTRQYAQTTRFDEVAEAEHNARIKDTYARLINPQNNIDEILNRAENRAENKAEVQAPVENQSPVITRPYLVENARADAAIFRADSAVNSRLAQASVSEFGQPVCEADMEDEDEDLRPTPTTIQYQTIGCAVEEDEQAYSKSAKLFAFGRKEKIVMAVVVAVVIALVALIIINSTIIRSLNADVAQVQDSITTVRAALAGVNSTVEEIINNAMGH